MSQKSKKSIREQISQQRRQLTLKEQRDKAQALLQTFGNQPEFLHSRRIAAYYPVQGEIDPRPLLKRAFQMGKKCYLPVLHPLNENRLLFYEFKPHDRLIINRFGIPEPSPKRRKPIASWMLNLVLVPLVAFNEKGQRLGQGKGYYDRSFAFLKNKPKSKQPKLIGLAYDFQRVDPLPQDDWDIRLAGIATEKRFIISDS